MNTRAKDRGTENPMDEPSQNAVRGLEGDYETLNRLPTRYEAWGGQSPAEHCAVPSGRSDGEIER